jgi:hypothetical protein
MMHGQLSIVFWRNDTVHCRRDFMVYDSLIILAYDVNPEFLATTRVLSALEYTWDNNEAHHAVVRFKLPRIGLHALHA